MSFVITDMKDRVIISVNDKGKIGIARYPDLSRKCKEYIVDVYAELTGESREKVELFLNYKEKDLFCA